MKKKILIFSSGYLPAKKYGGPITSLSNIVEACGDLFDIKIVTVDHDLGESERFPDINSGWNKVGKAKVLYLTNKELTWSYIVRFLKSEDFDLVYLNSFFNARIALPVLWISKRLKKPVLLAPRGELCGNAFNLKRTKKLIYLNLLLKTKLIENVWWQVTSLEEKRDTSDRVNPSTQDKFILAPNLPSIPKVQKEKIQKKQGFLRSVFLSRINPKKNLLAAIRFIQKVDYETQFDIYGPCEDEAYWKECKELIDQSPNHIYINYCGLVPHEDVSSVLSQYDVFLLPTLSENYGHAIVESMLSGCPVIISDQTPWIGLENLRAGYSIPLSKEDHFIQALNEVAMMGLLEYSELVKRSTDYIVSQIKLNSALQLHIEMFNRTIEAKLD